MLSVTGAEKRIHITAVTSSLRPFFLVCKSFPGLVSGTGVDLRLKCSQDLFFVPVTQTNREADFCTRGPELWNNLPLDLRPAEHPLRLLSAHSGLTVALVLT